MQEFLTYMSYILTEVCKFLMAEPIIYFVGLIILATIAKLVINICYGFNK